MGKSLTQHKPTMTPTIETEPVTLDQLIELALRNLELLAK